VHELAVIQAVAVHILAIKPAAVGSAAPDPHGMAPHSVLAAVGSRGGSLPPTVLVGCEGADVGDGIGLSAAVSAVVGPALDAVVAPLDDAAGVRPHGDRLAGAPACWGVVAVCLGIPGQVVEMVDGYYDQIALVDVVGKVRKINVGMLEGPVRPRDWVLIHMGFAVEIVDRAAAEKALSGLEMMGRPLDAEEPAAS